MEPIIKQISEAFSMQPHSCFTCKTATDETAFLEHKEHEHTESCIKEIKLESLIIGHECGDPVEKLYYVGYNYRGKKAFQYLATTVNVHYEV